MLCLCSNEFYVLRITTLEFYDTYFYPSKKDKYINVKLSRILPEKLYKGWAGKPKSDSVLLSSLIPFMHDKLHICLITSLTNHDSISSVHHGPYNHTADSAFAQKDLGNTGNTDPGTPD